MIKKPAFLSKHLSPIPFWLVVPILLVLHFCSFTIKPDILDSGKNGSADPPEAKLKIRSNAVDSDRDGLSDFQEVHKYLTDPEKRDTDGDDVPDGDWSERREYTYSVRTILRFMPPFDEAALNDDYQDARVLKKMDDYIELEVIHYPLATAHESIGENPNWQRDYAGMTEYLKPGITTNWDAQMKLNLLAQLKADGIRVDQLTDKKVIERISSWLMKRSKSVNDIFTTYYVYFPNGQPSIYPGLEDAFDRDKGRYGWTIQEQFECELLGRGMFYNRIHGTCTSMAVYLTTVFKALGIPARMIITIPAVDGSNEDQINFVRERITHNRVRETMLAALRKSGQSFTAHTYNEVYVGNRWHRLNYTKLGQPILDSHCLGLQTHLYTFNDLSEANLAPTWGFRYGTGSKTTIFKHSNPYSAVTISELFGCHSNVSNPPFTSQDVPKTSGSKPPNIYILSPHSTNVGFSVFDEIVEIVKGATSNKTGRLHKKKSYDEIFIDNIWGRKPNDIVVLVFSLDTEDRIPETYEDLLPRPWPEIEDDLKQGKTVSLSGEARDMKIILLTAPKTEQLKQLIRESELLRAVAGKDEKQWKRPPSDEWTRTGRTKGPVEYNVTVYEDNWRKAAVSCRMVTNNVMSLWMNNNGAPRVPNGHASFVRNLTAVDSVGHKIPVKNYEEARWKTTPMGNPPITLSYDVILEHDTSDLPWGRDEAPYVTEDGVFWTGRALFIIGEMNNVTVRFDLPDGWRVSTPWQPIPNQAATFSLKDTDELTEAFIFAGTHIEERARVGDMEIILALGTQMKQSGELLQHTSQELLNAYAALFGGTVPGQILIVTNLQDRKHSLDGGVFGRSISMLMGYEPNKSNVERWAPFIAHEVFHLWNGQAINYAQQEYWFSEGFTEYYANVISTRIGLIGQQNFLRRLKQACESYYKNVGKVSIRQAGDSESRNSTLQYQGGCLVAATLDVRIRKATNNTKSLDDLMRQMYHEFGITGKKYTIEDVERITQEITGKTYTRFFQRYVRGTEEMSLEEDFGYMGLDLKKQITEELPDRGYVIHKLLHINSLSQTSKSMVVRRSQDAGYQDEDILLTVTGTPVETFKDLQRIAKDWKPGDKIELTLKRNHVQITMDITLGSEGQQIPLEREVNVSLEKKSQLNSSQKAILSGIIGQ